MMVYGLNGGFQSSQSKTLLFCFQTDAEAQRGAEAPYEIGTEI
jgi:hypothetical protein